MVNFFIKSGVFAVVETEYFVFLWVWHFVELIVAFVGFVGRWVVEEWVVVEDEWVVVVEEWIADHVFRVANPPLTLLLVHVDDGEQKHFHGYEKSCD